ncbi:MAG: glycosyl hydrolase, partial [Muribaculaceae bacterium]|nr:glycosyl hydrolase [Muribaculaceae bacterium]
MKKSYIIALVLAAIAVLPFNAWGQFNWPYTIQDGTIVTEVPQRPAGQRSALGMTVEKIPVVRVAFVGLGMRGPDAVERWTHIPGIEVKALCDHERDRAEACQEILRKASMPAADVYYGEYGYK